jgi:hypothetical protein
MTVKTRIRRHQTGPFGAVARNSAKASLATRDFKGNSLDQPPPPKSPKGLNAMATGLLRFAPRNDENQQGVIGNDQGGCA